MAENKRFEKESKKAVRDLLQIQVQNKNINNEKMEAIREKFVSKNAVSALTREIEWLQK
jgi:hypothetical protein